MTNSVFQAVAITDKVYWVGGIDWAVRDFHGYLTSRGTTYNAYLVLAQQPTLIDTVKANMYEEMMARVASVIDPKNVEIIVSNHAEPDHSGSLVRTIDAIKPRAVYASAKGAEALEQHYHAHLPVTVVPDKGTISLGDMTLTCAETKLVHWPDSMVSYLAERRLLFSQDAFGMHLADYRRFADEMPASILDEEAAKYFANILLPLVNPIRKALDKLGTLNVPIDMIAPDHGPIWRKDIPAVIERYRRWCDQPRGNKAVVLYDTMWSATELMARAIGEGLAAGGAEARLYCLKSSHRSDIATAILDAGALLVGAPTINGEAFPTLHDAMTYLRGLRPQGLVGAAFGCYGWGGEGAGDLLDYLKQMNVELMQQEPIRCKYAPDDAVLQQCRQLGLNTARRLVERTQKPPA